jgi:hypothetical protein
MTHHDVDSVDARNRPIADSEPVFLLIPPGLRPGLFALLNACGLDVGYAPFLTGENDLPVFLTSPMDQDDPQREKS